MSPYTGLETQKQRSRRQKPVESGSVSLLWAATTEKCWESLTRSQGKVCQD